MINIIVLHIKLHFNLYFVISMYISAERKVIFFDEDDYIFIIFTDISSFSCHPVFFV